jgi:hypothetical protein
MISDEEGEKKKKEGLTLVQSADLILLYERVLFPSPLL